MIKIFLTKITSLFNIRNRGVEVSVNTNTDNTLIVRPKNIISNITTNDVLKSFVLMNGETISEPTDYYATNAQIYNAIQAEGLSDIEDCFLGGVIGSNRIVIKQNGEIKIKSSSGASIVFSSSGEMHINAEQINIGNILTFLNGKVYINNKEVATVGGSTSDGATIVTSGQI